MLLSSNIWAVYGIGLERREQGCTQPKCASPHTTGGIVPASPFAAPLMVNVTASDMPTTPEQSINRFSALSPGAKAGAIASGSVFLLVTFSVVLELAYLRRKRRERALTRAVEEVERGSRRDGSDGMDKHGGEEESVVRDSRVEVIEQEGGKEAEDQREGVVLESKVEIVILEEGGWETDDDEEEWGTERERGRCAMSLPRRF